MSQRSSSQKHALRGRVSGWLNTLRLSSRFIWVIAPLTALIIGLVSAGSVSLTVDALERQTTLFISSHENEKQSEEESLRRALVAKGELASLVMAGLTAELVANEDTDRLGEVLQQVFLDDDIVYAAFLNAQGDPILESAGLGEDIKLVEQEIVRRGVLVGYAVVGLSFDSLNTNLASLKKRMDAEVERLKQDKRSVTQNMMLQIVIFTGIGIGALCILIYLLSARLIVGPLESKIRNAQAIAAGDLTQKPWHRREDEIGFLTQAMSDMLAGLRRIIRGIHTTSQEVDRSVGVLESNSLAVAEGAEKQRLELSRVQDLVDRMDERARNVDGRVTELAGLLDEASTSAGEITQSIESVSDIADQLAAEMETTSATLIETNANLAHIVEFLDTVSDTSFQVANAADELADSSMQVGENAKESRELVSAVRDLSTRQGRPAIEEMVEITERNQKLLENYSGYIRSLGERSSNIGQILEVISEIGEQTNLLSLNAAIIAAQAGDRGRTFAIIAQEIRTLSSATASSVAEIEEMIGGVQADVREVVGHIGQLLEEAARSLSSAHRARDIFTKIVEKSADSETRTAQIADAAERQMERISDINREVTQNAYQVGQIKKMVAEQKQGSDHIVGTVEEVRTIALRLKTGTREQVEGSRVISKTLAETHSFSMAITQALGEERDEMIESLWRISEVAENNIELMDALRATVVALKEQSARLLPEIDHFRLPDQDEEGVG